MADHNNTKYQLYDFILSKLNKQIENSKVALKSVEESKNNETKSSAGDKFETGRVMMQMEQEKIELQLSKTLHLKKILQNIDLSDHTEEVKLGTLIHTSSGTYFISIGFGKITIDGNNYYGISLDSPIGKLLFGKRKGDSYYFREKQIKILNIG